MAGEAGGWFRRRPRTAPQSMRVLTAAGHRIDLADRKEASRQRVLRQGWQGDAWEMRDSIGELRYAVSFLANCAARMRLFPGAYATGETDEPVALAEIDGVPPEVAAACELAMVTLGSGRLAIAALMKALSTNTTITGECWLLGREDPATGRETFEVRSIDEIVLSEDRWRLREMPSDPAGVLPWIELGRDTTVLARMWVPHPRWRLLADSPLRAIIDDCEALLIKRREIRAQGRSRIAGAGILLVPEELSIKKPNNDNGDPKADDFIDDLTDAMMTPIAVEGTASSVVPLVVRGPGEQLDKVRHLTLASAIAKEDIAVRAELVGIIATGLDLPKEIIEGLSEMNHWSAWQVDTNTFRHHVEPHVIECVDAITSAYLRPFLAAQGISPEWVARCAMWYDPTELVTHPDRTADAVAAHAALVISDAAYRDAAGFTDADAPSIEELDRRRLADIRALPMNLLMEMARRVDPTLVVPPITVSGTVPGIKPGGVDVGDVAPAAGSTIPATPALPVGPPATAPTPGGPSTVKPGPPPIVAAGPPPAEQRRLSHKLASIDRDLRTRLQTAANAAMLRQLERAGAKLRTKVAKDETLREKIAHRPNERLAAIVGPDAVTAASVTVEDLMGGDWASLRAQFFAWTAASQEAAIMTAIRIGSLATDDTAVEAARIAMAAGRDTAWEVLATSLTNLGHHLLYNPDPNTAAGEWAELNPDMLVPTGVIRTALGIAGGADITTPVDAFSTPIGQIGTGSTIADLLASAGASASGEYEWIHGPALNPFEPHVELDGVTFQNFDDPQLANPNDFPAVAFYLPGDHNGCTCDVLPIYGEMS